MLRAAEEARAGGATVVQPLSTGITYGLFDRVATDKIPMIDVRLRPHLGADGRVFPYVFPLITTYWDQAAAMIKYHRPEEGRRWTS